MEHYSDQVLNRYYEPSHCGALDEADAGVGTAQVGTEQSGEVVRVQVQVDEQGVIRRACFKVQGCCATVAAAEWVCSAVEAQQVGVAGELDPNKIIDELQLPSVKMHSVMLAVDAMRQALSQVALQG